MMRDLLLESRDEEWGTKCEVILPNIKGQKYVFGPSYPGERKGEEIIFYRNGKGLLDHTHKTIISVDDQWQYWIQEDAFVNEEWVNVVEIRRLKSGDRISFGDSNTRRGPRPHPIYCVKERIIGGSPLQANDDWISVTDTPTPLVNNLERVAGSSGRRQIEGTDTDRDSEALCKAMNELDAESPLNNNLILAEIMSYLPVKDLMNARLVCTKWREEASISRPLEKRGAVSFTFEDYLNPENSTRVFRYLHEMKNMKMRNLKISLFPRREWTNYYHEESRRFSPLQKMLDDLQKLLKSSNNFSSLFLLFSIADESKLPFLSTILEELGGKLVELALDGNLQFLPDVVPPFPLMPNLKQFIHRGYAVGGDSESDKKWASLLVPLFSKNLELFTCRTELAGYYLKAFLTQDCLMPKLKGVRIEGRPLSSKSLRLLLSLKNPLTSLELVFYPGSKEDVILLEKLLFKHGQSLQTLVISIGSRFFPNNQNTEVKFPSFPKLVKLELEYDERTRISWGWGMELDYKKHFKSLRKMKVCPLQGWKIKNDDPVFNSFFPEGGHLRCGSGTVKEVWIPLLSRYDYPLQEADPFRPRMDRIRNMFPSAEKLNFFYY